MGLDKLPMYKTLDIQYFEEISLHCTNLCTCGTLQEKLQRVAFTLQMDNKTINH